jgi:hypothetical protein
MSNFLFRFCSNKSRYILSPTHLHEFKSADRLSTQSPVMSLYLPEQKLGSQSEPGSSSHKFMLKGRQSGSMHRGHSWVFRAETYDTMQAWFSDLKELTEKTGEARNDFVRRSHARTFSGSSMKAPSITSSADAMEDDEADRQAFAGEQSIRGNSVAEGLGAGLLAEDARSEAGWRPPAQRPSPGGRFPSDLNVQRGLQAPVSPSSEGNLSDRDRDAIANAATLPGSAIPFSNTEERHPELPQPGPILGAPAEQHYTPGVHPNVVPTSVGAIPGNQSQYGDWMAPIAAGAGGAAVGAGVAHHYAEKNDRPIVENIDNVERQMDGATAVPEYGTSSAPIPVVAVTSGVNTARSNNDLSTVSTQDTAPTEYSSSRPAFGKQPTAKSVSTISDLHMPGEFPRRAS